MLRNPEMRARLRTGVVVLGFLVALAVMAFYWRNGRAQLAFSGPGAREIEECGAVLSGSSTIGLRLAPALVSDFLRHGGYEVGDAQPAGDGEVKVVGRRQGYLCTVTVRSSESTTGFQEAVAGEAHVVMSSRPILPHDTQQLDGATEPSSLFSEHMVAYDAVAMVVHASNAARQVSLDEVRTIALGMTTNWSDVGGADRPIHLYASLEVAGGDDFPSDLVHSSDVTWGTARDRPSARVVRDDLAVLTGVAVDPLSVGFVSASYPRDAAQV